MGYSHRKKIVREEIGKPVSSEMDIYYNLLAAIYDRANRDYVFHRYTHGYDVRNFYRRNPYRVANVGDVDEHLGRVTKNLKENRMLIRKDM